MTEPSPSASGRPHPRLILPFMAPVYETGSKYAWAMVRIITGLLLIPHGAKKLLGGMDGTAAFFAKVGYEPAVPLAWAVASTEFFGGILLVLGLLTRPAALAVAIFMAVAVQFHWKSGFFWGEHGYEYPLMWMVLALAIFFRGGGEHSLDKKWGREF